LPPDSDEIEKQARGHAWEWFAFHAAQRMQTFNFFFVATAFLVAGYASLFEKNHKVACVVALLGAWVAYWFNRLDYRNRQLVKAGEDALAACEERLADLAAIPKLKIVEVVERAGPRASSYRRVIEVIQWTIVAVFFVGAIYASFVLTMAISAVAVSIMAALTAPGLAGYRRRLRDAARDLADWLDKIGERF
jgi:hypothetical protein